MPTTLTIDEQNELARLLKKVLVYDRGFIPDSSYKLFHKLVPWPAVEVLIYDNFGNVLLKYRDDLFKGWHIEGGYMMVNETISQACNRHVRKDGMAEGVYDCRLIATHTWLEGEHPFGYPVSLIIACRAIGSVIERENVRWFSEIPEDIIPQQHPNFLRFFKQWIQSPAEELGWARQL